MKHLDLSLFIFGMRRSQFYGLRVVRLFSIHPNHLLFSMNTNNEVIAVLV